MSTSIAIVGVPVDLGAGRRGVDMGPSAVRYAGLKNRLMRLGHPVRDAGNISVPGLDELPLPDANEKLRYLEPIASMCRTLAKITRGCMVQGEFPLVIGGDHSYAIGSVSGVAAALAPKREKLGLIWLDAHADFNTAETTPSGNIHGMSLAALCGHGHKSLTRVIDDLDPAVDEHNCVIIGARDLDDGERRLLRQFGVHVFTMHDLDRRGMADVMTDALLFAGNGTHGIHLSLDLDSLDPAEAPGVGTPVPGGLTYREAHLACEMAFQHGSLVSMDLVECNPILDQHNKTAQLGVELICSALGQSIY